MGHSFRSKAPRLCKRTLDVLSSAMDGSYELCLCVFAGMNSCIFARQQICRFEDYKKSVVKMMVSPFFLRGVCVDKAEQDQQSLPCLFFNVCGETDIDLIRPDCCGRKVYTAGKMPCALR